MVERARKQIGLFTSILLLVSAVIIALIIYTMTMDKLREIATLKLIGAPDRTIIGLIVQQALAMGVIGFGFGALLITTIKDYFPRRVVLQPEDGLALAAVVILVCLLASGLGVRLALKIDPATALGARPMAGLPQQDAAGRAPRCLEAFRRGRDPGRCAARGQPRGLSRSGRRAARPERLRQDHAAQRDRLHSRAEQRLDVPRR